MSLPVADTSLQMLLGATGVAGGILLLTIAAVGLLAIVARLFRR